MYKCHKNDHEVEQIILHIDLISNNTATPIIMSSFSVPEK